MTAIWDTLGSAAYRLREIGWDDTLAFKLQSALELINEAIGDRPEYEKATVYMRAARIPLMQVLRDVIVPLAGCIDKDCQVTLATKLCWLIQGFHDFDHSDPLYNGKKTYGHFTEQVIYKKKNFKSQREKLLVVLKELGY